MGVHQKLPSCKVVKRIIGQSMEQEFGRCTPSLPQNHARPSMVTAGGDLACRSRTAETLIAVFHRGRPPKNHPLHPSNRPPSCSPIAKFAVLRFHSFVQSISRSPVACLIRGKKNSSVSGPVLIDRSLGLPCGFFRREP